MTNKAWIVAKFEYLRTIKRISFWITTLFFPVFIGVITFVSGYASVEGQKILEDTSDQEKNVVIVDESGFINKELIKTPYEYTDQFDVNIERLKKNEVEGLIYYPKNFMEEGKFKIYSNAEGNLLVGLGLSSKGNELIKLSGLTKIPNADIINSLTKNFATDNLSLDENGNVVTAGYEKFALPVISMVIFFFSVFISSSFLLQSVSEEKENRMIETIISIIPGRDLITGKIVGLSIVTLTQLGVWVVLSLGIILIGINNFNVQIPIDLSKISLGAVIINIFFTIIGFYLFASIMVGVGAISTNYKDSQGLSSIFVMLSIFPIYFITIIFADPNGVLAYIFSYFPLTSPMVLLLRNSLNAMTAVETIFGIAISIIYVMISFILAHKMFNIGALMYDRKPTLKEVLWAIRK